MVLASRAIRRQSVERFYFKHRGNGSNCAGSHGQSVAEINARRFAQTKESLLHKQFKRWLVEALAADPAFAQTMTETRWHDHAGVR